MIRGPASWRWYRRFLTDPIDCLTTVKHRIGEVAALGNPLGLWRGRLFVAALGPRYNRQVLGQPDLFRSGGQTPTGPAGSAQQRLRHGIFRMNGPRHRAHRQVLLPPFQRSAVIELGPAMTRVIDERLSHWRIGETYDMWREMRTMSAWIACDVLFGHDGFERSIEVGRMIEQWLDYSCAPRTTTLRLNLPGTNYRRLLEHADSLEAALHRAIERKREAGLTNDVLSALLRCRGRPDSIMSDDAVLAHVAILFLAAFETTAATLTWCLFLLSQHPDVAVELLDEVQAEAGTWPADVERLERLPRLDGVLLETLRLMPPVPLTMRKATASTDLDGLPLRLGDHVVISHYVTHRVPEIYPEPNRFDPSRWDGARPDPYEFIPFSSGPRLCLGYSFAMQELRLVITRILQRFRLAMPPGQRVDRRFRVTLAPARGLPLTVHEQDRDYRAEPVTGNVHDSIDL